ncbi:MAG: hypothetical protein N3F66_13040 [Spirochaetes bacterium]|nr:hypothetical protein [Spirochaetota bacterium]
MYSIEIQRKNQIDIISYSEMEFNPTTIEVVVKVTESEGQNIKTGEI